jgi:hypothetical protein
MAFSTYTLSAVIWLRGAGTQAGGVAYRPSLERVLAFAVFLNKFHRNIKMRAISKAAFNCDY